jgi:hypothetical protein
LVQLDIGHIPLMPEERTAKMRADPDESVADLTCHRCRYDLRAHPADGRCPECETPVAESRRMATLPRRPAWRDSDPRWRRRVVAGAWLLVGMLLMDVLWHCGLLYRIPLPEFFDFPGGVNGDWQIWNPYVYKPALVSMGTVLLFSKERRRRRSRLDWTRPCGILGSYLIFFLNALQYLYIWALVIRGSTTVFMTIPLEDRPRLTDLLARISSARLGYGLPYSGAAMATVIICCSATMALACLPLFDALRSSYSRRFARALTVALALTCLLPLAQVGRRCFGLTTADWADSPEAWFGTCFDSSWLSIFPAGGDIRGMPASWRYLIPVGVLRSLILTTIAILLAIAQFTSRRSSSSDQQ